MNVEVEYNFDIGNSIFIIQYYKKGLPWKEPAIANL